MKTNIVYLAKAASSKDQSLVLNPKWVSGFTDGEGNFSITYIRNNFSAAFKVTHKSTSLIVLVGLKNFFNCLQQVFFFFFFFYTTKKSDGIVDKKNVWG